MTLPVAQGFPDYQRNTPAANTFFVVDDATINALKDYGFVWVGYTPAIEISMQSIAGRGDLGIEYYASNNFGTFITRQIYGLPILGSMNFGTRVLGPWARITVTPGAAGFHYQLRLSATQRTGMTIQTGAWPILIATGLTAIGAGATVTSRASVTWPGRAHLTISQLVGAWNAKINYTTSDGVDHRFDAYDSGGGAQLRDTIILPAYPVGIDVNNTGAGASQFQVYLTGDPSSVFSG